MLLLSGKHYKNSYIKGIDTNFKIIIKEKTKKLVCAHATPSPALRRPLLWTNVLIFFGALVLPSASFQ